MNSGNAYSGHHNWQPYVAQHQPQPYAARYYGEPSMESSAVSGIAGLYYNDGHDTGVETYSAEEGGGYGSAGEEEGYCMNDNSDDDDDQEPPAVNADQLNQKPNKQQQQYLILWDTRYKQLADHKQRFNTCTVAKSKDKVLHSWVQKQRKQHRKGKLSQERYDRLALLDFDFEVLDATNRVCVGVSQEQYFDNRCNQLIKFKERTGHCKVPVIKAGAKKRLKLPDGDYALGRWLKNQDMNRLQGKLSQEKQDRLEGIGHVFTLNAALSPDKLWHKQYEALVDYKKKHGNTNVPTEWPENQSLSNWVKTQRERHRANKVSADRLKKLRAIGFDLIGVITGTFEQRYKELVEYKNQYGECRVPLRFECSTCLKEWAHNQKRKYIHNKISEERISRLKKLGFDFLPIREHRFEETFKALQKYKTEMGNCDVPSDYKEDPRLARWVEIQREKYAREKISIAHYSLLEEVGFTWEISQPEEENKSGDEEQKEEETPTLRESLYDNLHPDKPMLKKRQEEYTLLWETRYNELVEYKRKHGHCTVSKSHDKTLCAWVRTQREQYRNSNLFKDRYERLNLLGFDFKAKTRDTSNMIANRRAAAAQQWENRCQQLSEYHKIHGHCDVKVYKPHEKKKLPPGEDVGLGDWVMLMHKLYRKGDLDQAKYDRLTEVGWKPHLEKCSREDVRKWEVMYETLNAYKKKIGNCDVPSKYPQNQPLANWTVMQRDRFRQNRMSQDRIDKMRALGFQFKAYERESTRKALWEEKYNLLQEYKAEHGDCKVPKVYKDKGLGQWVQGQRQRYRDKKMSAEEESLLLLLGFDFTMTTRGMSVKQWQQWMESYNQLVEYKKIHGNCRVPTVYKENKELGSWVRTQRRKYKAHSLLWECKVRLDGIGFDWTLRNVNQTYEGDQPKSKLTTTFVAGVNKNAPPKPGHFVAIRGVDPDEAEWQSFFEQLKCYYTKYRTWAIDESIDQPLATWAKRQRTTKSLGTITKKHYDQLLELNFLKPESQRPALGTAKKPPPAVRKPEEVPRPTNMARGGSSGGKQNHHVAK